MAMKKITFEIDGKGDATVNLEGFQGKGCHAIVEGFAKVLGSSTSNITHKRDYNAPVIAANRLKQ